MGAKIDEPNNNGWTPLHTACNSSHHLDIIECLVENGSTSINTRNKYNQTPLYMACCIEYNDEIIKYLLENEANYEEILDIFPKLEELINEVADLKVKGISLQIA